MPPTQPDDLPEFYMPYPARLNPHLGSAREHTRRWADETGMFESTQDSNAPIWTEEDFERHDYALLCAYAHPDASAEKLGLVTDWYAWVFFFDDHFLEMYKRTGDLVGARQYLLGLAEFLPVHGTGAPPAPADPVERGLADLWARTGAGMSDAWRARFAESTRNLLEECRWELSHITEDRTPNPVDYVGVRRRIGGGPWSANLVEHALGAEVPEVVAGTRPLRMLRDAFSDSVRLRNDIFSYQREIQDEGEVNNGVLVVERFFDTAPQEAADIVSDLLTSRLHQFANTALTELPPLFDEHALGPRERADVLDYVKGLQHWLAGSHEWCLRSGRYANSGKAREPKRFLSGPDGLGTSAAHLGSLLRTARPGLPMPRGQSGYAPVDPPPMVMPYRARTSDHVDAVRCHAARWAEAMGMLDGSGVWDAAGFQASDFGLFSALVHPDSPVDELELANDWHVWRRFTDDYFTETFKRGRNPTGARAFLSLLRTFLPEDPERIPVPTGPVERGLADLWARTASVMPEELRRSFPRHVEDFVGSRLWELTNLIQNRVPDPVDYVEMRRRTGGAEFCTALARHLLGEGIPAEVFETPTMRALERSWSDIGPLRNDLFSYRKEIEQECEVSNGVLAVQRFFDCELRQAAVVLADLADARLRRFRHLAGTELPELCTRMALEPEVRRRLDRYVDGLADWLAGELSWSRTTGRYQRPGTALSVAIPLRPAGPRISVARLDVG